MTITSNTKPETNIVEVEFNINAEDFENAVQSVFLKKKKHIAIPGFRKGKATRKMIETTYGEGMFYEDAVNDLYRDAIPKVIDELGLEIVDAPEVEVSDLSKEAGVSFKLKLTVKPEVTIADYKGVEVELEPCKVTDEDIEKEFEKILADNARIIDASDRPVKDGDLIKFDFTGFCEDEAFDGGTATDFQLEIGSGQFIPGFEEQIVGKSVGEDFDVNVTFPEDYPSAAVKGKEALFKCKIHEISAKEIAVLDDEFVKDISEFDTMDEFREDTRKNIEQEKEQVRDVELEREVAEKIVELMSAEIPEVMFDDRIDEMARDWAFRYQMRAEDFAKNSGMTLEQYRDGFREMAEKQVKFRLSLEKIAELEGFEVSDEEVEAEYEKMSSENRMSAEKVRQIVTPQAVACDLKTEKALKLIKESAKVKEVKSKKKKEEKETKEDKS
jgi:trigger factor